MKYEDNKHYRISGQNLNQLIALVESIEKEGKILAGDFARIFGHDTNFTFRLEHLVPITLIGFFDRGIIGEIEDK